MIHRREQLVTRKNPVLVYIVKELKVNEDDIPLVVEYAGERASL